MSRDASPIEVVPVGLRAKDVAFLGIDSEDSREAAEQSSPSSGAVPEHL